MWPGYYYRKMLSIPFIKSKDQTVHHSGEAVRIESVSYLEEIREMRKQVRLPRLLTLSNLIAKLSRQF